MIFEPRGYGWEEFVDQRGRPCVYCAQPGFRTLIVQPTSDEGHSFRRGIRVPVCRSHALEPQPPSPAELFRRRKATADQLSWDV